MVGTTEISDNLFSYQFPTNSQYWLFPVISWGSSSVWFFVFQNSIFFIRSTKFPDKFLYWKHQLSQLGPSQELSVKVIIWIMKPKYTPKWFAPKENRQKVVPTCLHFTSVAEKIADYVQADRIQQICKWIRQIHVCYKTSVQFCRTCWFSAIIIPLFQNISIVFNHYQEISLKMINAHKNTQGPVI